MDKADETVSFWFINCERNILLLFIFWQFSYQIFAIFVNIQQIQKL